MGQPDHQNAGAKSGKQVIRELTDKYATERGLRLQAEADAAKLLAMYDSARGELNALKARCERMKQAAPEVWRDHCSKEALRRSKRAASDEWQAKQ